MKKVLFFACGCFQWFKDTKMKANHNKMDADVAINRLFPVVQRY